MQALCAQVFSGAYGIGMRHSLCFLMQESRLGGWQLLSCPGAHLHASCRELVAPGEFEFLQPSKWLKHLQCVWKYY